jgi:glucose-6-phosphate 1-dehydrogenase
MNDARQADLFVILGATGDLAQRMLFPSLYFLDADGLLPANVRIIGAARSGVEEEKFLAEVRAHVADRAGPMIAQPVRAGLLGPEGGRRGDARQPRGARKAGRP